MNRNHFAWLLVIAYACVDRKVYVSAQSKSHVPYKIYIAFVVITQHTVLNTETQLRSSIARTKDARYIHPSLRSLWFIDNDRYRHRVTTVEPKAVFIV